MKTLKFKSFFALMLALCCLSFIGCAKKTYELAWDGFCYSLLEAGEVRIILDGKDKGYIIGLLNDGAWQDGLAASEEDGDYLFITQRQRLSYSTQSGTFLDLTDNKTLILSEKQRNAVNDLLKNHDLEDHEKTEPTSKETLR